MNQLMCAADRAGQRANMSRSLVKHNQPKRSEDAANAMESGNAAEVETLSWAQPLSSCASMSPSLSKGSRAGRL